MLKVLIVDDEKYIRDELRYFLEKYEDIEIVGETGEGEEVIYLVDSCHPDIVFLDIQLGKMNGLLLARKILDKENPPFVVLATAYNEYAIQGFEINVADYILKPFSEERLKVAIDRIRKQNDKYGAKEPENHKEEINLNKLCVFQNNRLVLMDIEDIQYVEAENKEVAVYAGDKVYYCNYSLKELEEKFKNNKFIRTHKSYIVNIDFIEEIIPWFNYTYKITMKGNQDIEIPVSRNYLKKFKRLLGI